MLKRSIASINYRLNVKPFETMPAGSRAWISTRQSRLRELEAEAHKLVGNSSITPNTDYTGAGRTDYLLLYQYVLQKRPKHVLELGSGITTHYLARAMKAAGCGTLTTVDHIAHYSDATRDLLPDELRDNVSFIVTPMVGAMWGVVSVMKYQQIPRAQYDLIFVDGPSVLIGATSFPSIDALNAIADSGHPADVIIDNRLATAHRYSCWCDTDVIYDPLIGVAVIRNLRPADIQPQDRSPYGRSRLRIGDAFDTLEVDPSVSEMRASQNVGVPRDPTMPRIEAADSQDLGS